mgnify:CR=1 FL=1
MEYRKFDNIIIARINKGEEILEQLKAIAITENIKLASINALGAINDFTVLLFSKTTSPVSLSTILEIKYGSSNIPSFVRGVIAFTF